MKTIATDDRFCQITGDQFLLRSLCSSMTLCMSHDAHRSKEESWISIFDYTLSFCPFAHVHIIVVIYWLVLLFLIAYCTLLTTTRSTGWSAVSAQWPRSMCTCNVCCMQRKNGTAIIIINNWPSLRQTQYIRCVSNSYGSYFFFRCWVK